MAISSLGVGSGLDTQGLLNQLLTAQRAPTENRLNRKEAQIQAQLSALGSIKGALSDFQSALSGLKELSGFQGRKTQSSDSAILTASASTTAPAGSYNLVVGQLAKSHSVASTGFASATDTVGMGTLTFRFGTTVYDKGSDTYTSFTQKSGSSTHVITIGSSNNTLEGIRDAVNDANIGVRASIVNDGSGYRLVFNSTNTGAENSLEITVGDDDLNNTDTANLSRLAFNSAATNLEQTVGAQNASFTVDGLTISSAKNTGITGVVDGVTLSLAAADAAKTIKLDISLDKSAVKDKINALVEGYNKLVDAVVSVSGYNSETKAAGVLIADPAVRGIANQLRRVLGSSISNTGAYRTLSEIGVKTQSDGKLAVDNVKLDAALDKNYDDVGSLFAAGGRITDSLITYSAATADTKAGTYAINLSQIATQGKYTGTNVNSLVVDATNDMFTVSVDGTTSTSITLTQKTYASGTELATEVQSRINGDSTLSAAGRKVSVAYIGGQLVINSDRYGSASKVSIASADAGMAASLGVGSAVGSSVDGVDVAGTIGGVGATGAGRILTGIGDPKGLAIEVTGGSIGDRGTVTFDRGVADQLYTQLNRYLESDGLLDSRSDGLNKQIESISAQREALEKRLEAIEKRYRAQFTALDTLLAQMQTTSNYLTQQLANLPGFTRSQ